MNTFFIIVHTSGGGGVDGTASQVSL